MYKSRSLIALRLPFDISFVSVFTAVSNAVENQYKITSLDDCLHIAVVVPTVPLCHRFLCALCSSVPTVPL